MRGFDRSGAAGAGRVKLLRLKADGFGPLRGEYRFAPDRLNLVLDQNESGKSSLLAAIAAALYGLDGDKRTHRLLTPLERWRPWGGGPYRIELELEAAGERLTVTRDFERGTVEVWNDRGREVTEAYRLGKDEFAIGQVSLGLDASEFEKCAFIRQGELEEVVPGDEKARRASTLQARLENAADTRVGDTNAIEALRALEGAAESYACPELGSTLRVETTIQRLETKRELLDAEIHALEHDLESMTPDLEELARVVESEQEARESLARLEAERRRARAAEVRDRLDQDAVRRREVERLRAEAESLAPMSGVPAAAEAEFRDAVARLDETVRRLRPPDAVEGSERETPAATAGDLEAQMRSGLEDPSRDEALLARFGSLLPEQRETLRGYLNFEIECRTELSGLERDRVESRARLREIEATRRSLRVPGWILAALGFASTGLAAALALGPRAGESLVLLFGGLPAAVLGIALLLVASGRRRAERQAARDRLREASERVDSLTRRRADNEARLEALARELGCSSPAELLRDWNDHGELLRRRTTLEEQRRAGESAAELRARAVHALESAGIAYDPGRGWADHLEDLAARVRGAERHALLTLELIPAAERALLDEAAVRNLKEELAALPGDAAPDPAPAAGSRTLAALEQAIEELRGVIDLLVERRSTLRIRIEERSRRYHAEHAAKAAERGAMEGALARARRFRQAIELASTTLREVALDTHRRWAQFLSQRVGELARSFGAQIEQVRFGDDFDFSVRIPGGGQQPRGKALMQLSAGARDQLHLAVRLAIGEFLSRGREPVPLLVDDCFATSDDERARAGMKLLIEQFAPRHQVILATCHRARHEAFAALDRGLYADKVCRLEVKAPSWVG